MRTRKIGSFDVSIVGLGCNNFGGRCDAGQSAAVVHAALDSGINFFDTADAYSMGQSEQYLGDALKGVRDEVVIATKFGHPMTKGPGGDPVEGSGGGKPSWVIRAAEDSLRRLGTDHIDLYQMHVPDESVPMEETLDALNRLVKEGKVLEIGSSNYTGAQLNKALSISHETGAAAFVSAQNHYSLLVRGAETDIMVECENNEIAFLPYFPLASGLLTGKYRRTDEVPEGTRLAGIPEERRKRWLNDENLRMVEELEAFAKDHDRSLLELAFSWLISHPVVASVIAGATRPEQVAANAAATDWDLDAEELLEISEITQGAVPRS